MSTTAPEKEVGESRQTHPSTRPSNNGGLTADDHEHMQQILLAMLAFRNGDFSQRLPAEWTGVHGKISDAFRAIGAVAKGDLSRARSMALEVDGRALEGEFLRSAKLVNTMIEQLSVFTSEVTRVAREVGTEGKLGGQAQVKGVSGVWKDLTESVNQMAGNLTAQVRNIAEVTIAVANGDLSKKITVDVRGEILQLKEAINTMVDQLRSFASEVTRVAREVGTEGKLGGQAVVPGRGRHLEGPDRLGQRDGLQPDRPGPQHRRRDHRRRAWRPVAQDHRRRQGRDPRAEERPSTRWSISSTASLRR
jgi:HAMP domain-containing protein